RTPTLACYRGRRPPAHHPAFSPSLMPPPEPTHPYSIGVPPSGSAARRPDLSTTRLVPPTAVTYADEAGQFVPGGSVGTPTLAPYAQPDPLSPDDAKRVCPCIAPWVSSWSVASIEPSREGPTEPPPMLAHTGRARFCGSK